MKGTYMYIVGACKCVHRTFPSLVKIASKPLPKCQSTREVNILVMVESSKDSIETMLRCLVNLPVMWLRPPPGGPIAHTNNWIERHKHSINTEKIPYCTVTLLTYTMQS